MALNTNSYFSNSLVGVPSVGGDVDIYEINSNPKYAIGTKYERQDGAIFRYGLFGATVNTAGYLFAGVQSDIDVPWAVGNTCASPISTYQMGVEQPGVYPGSLGSRYVVVVKSSSTNGDFEGAYFQPVIGPGAGYTYRIRTNTTSNDPATGLVRLELYDKLQAAVGTTTTFQIVGSRHNDLIQCDTAVTQSAVPVGWNVGAVSSGTYGWVQSKGILMARIDSAAMTLGVPVTVSTNLVGNVAPYAFTNTTAGRVTVGICVSIGSASTWAGISATIE